MFFKTVGSPDSIPRKTALQRLLAIRSKASSSEFEHLKKENQSNENLFLIINRQISLNLGSGTLKVSSIKTTLLTPAESRYLSCCSITSRLARFSGPARAGYLQKAQEK